MARKFRKIREIDNRHHESAKGPPGVSAETFAERNNAEILGLVLGLITGTHENPPVGSPAWAVEKSILENWTSMEAFGAFFDEQGLEAQRGWVSLLKARAAEHLVAYETGGEAHEDWNIPEHDVVTPEGDFLQVKTGSRVYVEDAANDVPEGIDVHTGSEGQGLEGVTAHKWNADELEEQLREVDSADNADLELLGSSVAVGVILSGRQAWSKVRGGEIALNEAPRYIVVESAGNTVRCAIIGIATTSGSPIIVSGAAAYLLYRNRKLLAKVCGNTYRAIQHPLTRRIAIGFGRATLWTATQTFRAMKGPTAKGGGKLLLKGLATTTKYSFGLLVRKSST